MRGKHPAQSRPPRRAGFSFFQPPKKSRANPTIASVAVAVTMIGLNKGSNAKSLEYKELSIYPMEARVGIEPALTDLQSAA